MILAKRNHPFEKSENISVGIQTVPVKPDRLVIAIIGISLPTLAIHELVSGTEHRGSIGKHQQTAEVLYLALSKRAHEVRYIGFAFPPAVPASFPVVCVGNEIIQT